MSACEWCWEAAQRQAYHNGASVSEMYHLIMKEQEQMGEHAVCPNARAILRDVEGESHATNGSNGGKVKESK